MISNRLNGLENVEKLTNKPGHIECKSVAKQGADVKGIVEGFVPEQVRKIGGDQKAENQDQWQVVSGRRSKH